MPNSDFEEIYDAAKNKNSEKLHKFLTKENSEWKRPPVNKYERELTVAGKLILDNQQEASCLILDTVQKLFEPNLFEAVFVDVIYRIGISGNETSALEMLNRYFNQAQQLKRCSHLCIGFTAGGHYFLAEKYINSILNSKDNDPDDAHKRFCLRMTINVAIGKRKNMAFAYKIISLCDFSIYKNTVTCGLKFGMTSFDAEQIKLAMQQLYDLDETGAIAPTLVEQLSKSASSLRSSSLPNICAINNDFLTKTDELTSKYMLNKTQARQWYCLPEDAKKLLVCSIFFVGRCKLPREILLLISNYLAPHNSIKSITKAGKTTELVFSKLYRLATNNTAKKSFSILLEEHCKKLTI